jgi:predicted AlkP superfamily phosphohydrolase/phosphomutase
MTSRILIVGLDGATWDVLEPFMADGDLPNLSRIREQGGWGELRSTLPPLSAPAWSTFLTGKSPARHGVFHFVDWLDDTGDGLGAGAGLVDGSSIESPTLWDVAAHHDRRVGVINVPMTYPPRPVNGVMITGLLTPPDASVFTHPPELSSELPDYQIDLDRFIAAKPFAALEGGDKQKRIVKPDLELIDEFYAMEDQRGRTALRLLQSEPWGAFTVVFTSTDRMGHYFWPYHRAADLDGTPEADELHSAIRRFYRRIDEMIGELIAAAGEGAVVMVVSDHGMGPIYTKNTHWNTWLFEKGYINLAKTSTRTFDGWLLRLGIPRDKLRRLAKSIPGLMKSKPVHALKKAATAEIDKETSTVYYERWFDPVGGFRINAEGEEKERIRAELMEAVAAVVDPDTGEPIVDEVLAREDCLAGPHLDRAPDVIVVMDPDYGSSDRMSSYSSIVTQRPNIGDPGGHQLQGIFMCAGVGIAAPSDPYTGLSLEDIAPTVLHLLDVGVPSDMDGRVLSEIFASGGPADRDAIISEAMTWWPDEETARAGGPDRVAADERAVRDRLRALGYFE